VTHSTGNGPARRAGSSGLRPLLPLLMLFACGREPPREAPPQNGKPAEPAPPAPAPEREEQGGAPLEKDKAEPAPAAPQLAPAAPPAASPPRPVKPAAKGRATGKSAPSAEALDWDLGAAPGDRARTLRQRLDDAVRLSTPDCRSARERKEAICDLAQQICQMVERDPDVASVESYCDDAKRRCNQAEQRTAQRCH
jgi:hypothetical protein